MKKWGWRARDDERGPDGATPPSIQTRRGPLQALLVSAAALAKQVRCNAFNVRCVVFHAIAYLLLYSGLCCYTLAYAAILWPMLLYSGLCCYTLAYAAAASVLASERLNL